jgi:hypothetical protein
MDYVVTHFLVTYASDSLRVGAWGRGIGMFRFDASPFELAKIQTQKWREKSMMPSRRNIMLTEGNLHETVERKPGPRRLSSRS